MNDITVFIIVAVVAILTYGALRSAYWPLRFLAGVSWIGLGVYWKVTPPVTLGNPVDVILIALLFITGFAFMLMGFHFEGKDKDGFTIGRFKSPFAGDPKIRQTMRDRVMDYRYRMNNRGR